LRHQVFFTTLLFILKPTLANEQYSSPLFVLGATLGLNKTSFFVFFKNFWAFGSLSFRLEFLEKTPREFTVFFF
jgi:hypothetical protein